MKIGITGGIGSGKTTICKYFENKGFFVYYSDIEAKKLANNNVVIKENIMKLFGDDSYIDGIYNTKHIRDLVFNDRIKLMELNRCFENIVIEDFIKQSLKHRVSFFESALIFEHKLHQNFDVVIGVYCDEMKVMKRIKERDGFNEKDIINILSNQLEVKNKMERCDVIFNTTNGINDKDLENMINDYLK